jgi:Flp pilus assembly pilin Flp
MFFVKLYRLLGDMLFVGRRGQEGQGLPEYALIIALIGIIAITALLFMGGQISDKLVVVGDAM